MGQYAGLLLPSNKKLQQNPNWPHYNSNGVYWAMFRPSVMALVINGSHGTDVNRAQHHTLLLVESMLAKVHNIADKGVHQIRNSKIRNHELSKNSPKINAVKLIPVDSDLREG